VSSRLTLGTSATSRHGSMENLRRNSEAAAEVARALAAAESEGVAAGAAGAAAVAAAELFEAWDADSSGFLEVKEVNEVLTQYNGGDFDGKEFMKLYDDDGKPDARLNRKEFAEWLAEEVVSFENTTAGAVVYKLTNIVLTTNLFNQWDADKSGFLEVKELNRVLKTYNGGDFDGKTFMKDYDDDGKPDARLNRKEFAEWLAEEAESFATGSVRVVIGKLAAIIGAKQRSAAPGARGGEEGSDGSEDGEKAKQQMYSLDDLAGE
jgi:Ca2+-binding EF-hand superfamily protein